MKFGMIDLYQLQRNAMIKLSNFESLKMLQKCVIDGEVTHHET